MKAKSSYTICLVLVLAAATAAADTATQVAQPISPGGARAFPALESRCPTFSWTAVDRAQGYELVVYPLPDREALLATSAESARAQLDRLRPALRVLLPARASSWTPSGAGCLVAGESYAWAVRTRLAGGEVTSSDTLLFQIAARPSAREVSEALTVLREYVADLEIGGSGSTAALAELAEDLGEGLPAMEAAPVEASQLITSTVPTLDMSQDRLILSSPTGGTSISATGVYTITGQAAGITINSDPVVTMSNDQDSLGALTPTCSNGQVAKKSGAAWVCGDDEDAIGGLSCLSGQIAEWNAGTSMWQCGNDDTGGGGGASVVVGQASTESPGSSEGMILSIPFTAPAGGCVLHALGTASFAFDDIDTQDDFDDPLCWLCLDDNTPGCTPLTASKQQVAVDPFIRYATCPTKGEVGMVPSGAHTLYLRTDVDTDAGGFSDAAVLINANLALSCFPI
jgi:hypothetical protein